MWLPGAIWKRGGHTNHVNQKKDKEASFKGIEHSGIIFFVSRWINPKNLEKSVYYFASTVFVLVVNE